MKLRSLPDGLCNLVSLISLNLAFCERLQELPDLNSSKTSKTELQVSVLGASEAAKAWYERGFELPGRGGSG